MRPTIFITQPIANSAIARLREVAEVEINPDASRAPDKKTLIAGARNHDILFCLLHDKIDRDVIAANPNLRAIATMSITPDNIDIPEATARRIPVTVVAPLAAESTADIAFTLLLAAARNIPQGDSFLRKGGFPAAAAASTCRTCIVLGVARITASMAGSANATL